MAKKIDSKRKVTPGEMDLSKYEVLDGEWRKIGLAAPARRALVDAKLYKVSDLRKISLADLSDLHGMGKSAIARLSAIMEAKKIRFR
jgi:DNA repair protein RadC